MLGKPLVKKLIEFYESIKDNKCNGKSKEILLWECVGCGKRFEKYIDFLYHLDTDKKEEGGKK